MDFVTGLRSELAIITNGSSPINFNEAEKIAKNMKSTSLINKNVLAVTTTSAVT